MIHYIDKPKGDSDEEKKWDIYQISNCDIPLHGKLNLRVHISVLDQSQRDIELVTKNLFWCDISKIKNSWKTETPSPSFKAVHTAPCSLYF